MMAREHREDDRKLHRSHRYHTRGREIRHKSDRRSASPRSSYANPPNHWASQTPLPLGASPISKHDFTIYQPMFALYLDIQKQLLVEDLSDTEIRGRWKSFVGKWNRGGLAEGWYDPATFQKAIDAASQFGSSHHNTQHGKASLEQNSRSTNRSLMVESSDEDMPGPPLPEANDPHRQPLKSSRAGPTIPDLQDLELRKELAAEDTQITQQLIRDQRKAAMEQQKSRLEELVPRSEAGTKERILEKKREKSDANRAFAAAKLDTGDVVEVPESDLLGDEDGGIEGLKRQKRDMERKKNEREIRREEVMRAREVERVERVKRYREKEETTMKALVELARARFG